MFKRFLNIFPGLIFSVLVLTSCSEYNKVLKSSDVTKKYEMAIKLYDEEKYYKAFPLLEELITVYRGTDKAEKIYYYYAYCNYHMGDYAYANYYFKSFVKTFPNSPLAEECFFMNAYTHYLDSPEPTLDQTNTLSAINELQLFVDKYPSSAKVVEANTLIDKLYLKLETKSYNICKLYYKTENYKSAVICIQNTLNDFPATRYAEELSFLIVKSHYLYAVNSVESKKEERLRNALKAYKEFAEKFPTSDYLKEAQNIYDNTLKSLNKQQSNT